MSAGATSVLVSNQVAELIHAWGKAMRAFQMYLPNNPIHQRAADNLGAAFAPIWAATDELLLRVAETEFYWEESLVYQQHAKSESLAWMLYKDGLRTLTLRRGVEQGEMARFLDVVNRARYLPPDAGDDLLTLLWAEEFVHISYHFTEPFADGVSLPEASPPPPSPGAEVVRGQVAEEAPPRPSGVVDLDDFDSTLYFLDEREVAYVLREVEHEYNRDVRGSALAVLFDLFELQAEPDVRGELLDILDTLFPHLLNARDFRAVANLLREVRLLQQRAPGLDAVQRARLQEFELRLSDPAIVRQLLQSLEDAAIGPNDADVSEVLRELQASALEPIVTWIPQLKPGAVRSMLEAAADRIASGNTPEVLRLLRGGSEALEGIIGICGRLRLQGAIPGLGEVLSHRDAAVRLEAVQALAQIGSPGALAHLDRAIEDADRAVRIAAVRAAGAKGYRNALRRIEAVVGGKGLDGLDLTEKMAFFEAYGAIAGASAMETLESIVLPRGLLRRKESPETRACAIVAIGRTRASGAQALLERLRDDKEPMVRNAAMRALRELGA